MTPEEIAHEICDEWKYSDAQPGGTGEREPRYVLEAIIARRFAKALADARAQAWRPIETAPRDGTEIDIWSRFGERHPNAWWDIDGGGWRTSGYSGWWVGITHWQPLPSPPQQSGGS